MVLGWAVKEAGSTTIQELIFVVKALLREAASKRTAHRCRAFMAKVAVELLGGSARRARSHFGWNRDTVELGLRERAGGITCLDNFQARGNKKAESKQPRLEADIRALADPHSQADSQFKSALSYTRLSAPSLDPGERLARGRSAGRAHDELDPQSPGLPLAQCGQKQARKKQRPPRPSSPT